MDKIKNRCGTTVFSIGVYIEVFLPDTPPVTQKCSMYTNVHPMYIDGISWRLQTAKNPPCLAVDKAGGFML